MAVRASLELDTTETWVPEVMTEPLVEVVRNLDVDVVKRHKKHVLNYTAKIAQNQWICAIIFNKIRKHLTIAEIISGLTPHFFECGWTDGV